MFNRSRRNFAHWFTLSMGSILILFAGMVYYQWAVVRLEESDRLLYRKARIMAANVYYDPRQGEESIDLDNVPILGNYSLPLGNEITYARWYSTGGQLRQFYGTPVPAKLQTTAAFETIQTAPQWLRQITLPVQQGGQTIGYLQVAVPLTDAQAALREVLLVFVLAVPLTLGAIALVGWYLGGRAMHPIRESYLQLQRFTSDASHELRAPVAAILSNAQVGLMSPIDQGQPKHKRLENIAETAKRMNTLVNNLLFLARQAGRIDPVSIQPIDLNTLLKEMIDFPSIQAMAQHLTLHLELPEEKVIVNGNADLLRQAVVNLIANACKYTSANGKVWLRLIDRDYDVLIQVEDTGVGIPQSDLPHIFDRFYRVNQERTRETGGSGLGLAIAKQIVEAHGGRLAVTSQVGQGSLFQMELLPS
ncbi:sensor histidine kinase [Leptolyngbya ohadii]|uniref:sensor histidine kinase n=1 Tax=Leptolyngbya ohadii TaxID=1962290 RepID=UPI000B59A6EF|nr:HAMP domain-containing sensor histidine kinase [Leptolyngbya ohadii]